MNCPSCNKNLEKAIFFSVEINYCPRCLGSWFEQDELRLAKDEKDKDLIWLDIDLWKDKEKLDIYRDKKLCPACQLPLYTVGYGDSRIHVETCSVCRGIWLDRGEFKEIIEYLKENGDYQILNNYLETLTEEFKEIFTGPESFREEVLDFLAFSKIFNYKFLTQHPNISKIISNLPK